MKEWHYSYIHVCMLDLKLLDLCVQTDVKQILPNLSPKHRWLTYFCAGVCDIAEDQCPIFAVVK